MNLFHGRETIMQSCAFCGVPMFGSRCANMHCHKSRKPRALTPTPIKKTPSRRGGKKSRGPQPQNDGSFLIPYNIHLEMEDSLPKYFGYKTDKKSTEEGSVPRSACCTMPDWKSNQGPETAERLLNLAHRLQMSERESCCLGWMGELQKANGLS